MKKFMGEFFGDPLAEAERAKETQSTRDTARSRPSPVVSLGYRYVGVQVMGVAMTVVVGCFVFKPFADWSVPVLILFLAFLTAVALRLLTFGETQFKAVPPQIIRQWRFLGLISVWQREHPLKNFSGVLRRHSQCEYRSSNRAWEVGLVGPSDFFLPMQLYHSRGIDRPCPEVDAYASRLAEVTGLPLLEPTEV